MRQIATQNITNSTNTNKSRYEPKTALLSHKTPPNTRFLHKNDISPICLTINKRSTKLRRKIHGNPLTNTEYTITPIGQTTYAPIVAAELAHYLFSKQIVATQAQHDVNLVKLDFLVDNLSRLCYTVRKLVIFLLQKLNGVLVWRTISRILSTANWSSVCSPSISTDCCSSTARHRLFPNFPTPLRENCCR